MKKVLAYSLLLVAGLIGSQFVGEGPALSVRVLTMFFLSFIMIHVGYEFEIDKTQPRKYAWDYLVAGTAAAFPWVFAACYFVFVMAPQPMWGHVDLWKEVLLAGRFASPTSAGVLFSMLAAAGLAATWVFQKARVLAIFDDLDTILLMIPLKMLMVGNRWQLWVIVLFVVGLLMLAWRYLHSLRLSISWPWVMGYSALIVAASEALYLASKAYDPNVPVHLEVLLPAFVLGCVIARPAGADPHVNDATPGAEEGPESATEQRVSTVVSACFMLFVGLSMPPIFASAKTTATPAAAVAVGTGAGASTPAPSPTPGAPAPSAPVAQALPAQKKPTLAYEGVDPKLLEEKRAFPGWGAIAFHVIALTILINLGKMFPALCYRREATFYERLAVAIGMFPRGEVGAGVLVVSLTYGIGGPLVTVAALSLALNLLMTGVFILIVKRLIAMSKDSQPLQSVPN